MKQLLLVLITIITFTLASNAQTYKLVDGQLVEQKKTSTKKKSVKTKMTITKKGVNYPVYKGSKGSYYILRVSKKTKKEYKQYIKITS